VHRKGGQRDRLAELNDGREQDRGGGLTLILDVAP